MSLKKRIIAVLVSIIAAISVIMGGVFCSADADFGTSEDGMYQIGQKYWIQQHDPYMGGEGFANGNFEQGFKYWANNWGKRPSDVSTIQTEENGNKYLHFNGEQCQENWEGIVSPLSLANGVQEGTPVAILYKWRGDNRFQIYLEQFCVDATKTQVESVRVSASGYTTVIHEAYDEGEWNIGVTSGGDGIKTVITPKYEDKRFYFVVGIQICEDITATFDIDDVQLVIRQENGIVTDLSGKQLYDLNNLETRAIEETEFDLSDFDFKSKKKPMPGPSGITASVNAVIESVTNKNGVASIINPASPWFWVVVAVGVIIIAAAVVAIILLLAVAKKKNAVKQQEDEAEVTEEPSAESEEAE